MAQVDLHASKRNTFSQNGEDGVLEALLSEMGLQTGNFCEFGAWDGQKYSNCFLLLKQGWSGVFIEGNGSRIADLKRNIKSLKATPVNAWVQVTGENTLDKILERARSNGGCWPIDLLSIDIDSNDFAVWKSIKTFRPKIVIIEYNATIPVDVEFINTPGRNQGNSCRVIANFAETQAYDLVAVTATNLIFVDREFRPASVKAFHITDSELSLGTRYFFGYDGGMIMATAGADGTSRVPEVMRIPWKSAWFAQPTPVPFRHFDQSGVAGAAFTVISFLGVLIGRPIGFFKSARNFRSRNP